MSRLYLAGGVLALLLATHTAAYFQGRTDGAINAEQRAVKQTFQQLKERGLINEAIRDLDDCRLLVELGGVSDDCSD